MRLNENIKAFRTFKNITQSDLANKLGKSKNVISNWERGDNQPDPDTIEKMCHIFGITPNQIFGWEPHPELEEYWQQRTEAEKALEKLHMEKLLLQKKLKDIEKEMAQEYERFKKLDE